MQFNEHSHLAYCTNVHPAETWQETFDAISTDALAVRDALIEKGSLAEGAPYAIGLRLSALAAQELLEHDHVHQFIEWLEKENCYVFTINGFPYGAFHGTEVKEKVYLPDWSTIERLEYTKNLFTIIARICPDHTGGSVSTLPGSFKEFSIHNTPIFEHLYLCAEHIAELADHFGKDLHLGLEPEPLGNFENTKETIQFFNDFRAWAEENDRDSSLIDKHIGVNYDTCHFSLEFDDCAHSLSAFTDAGIRISKIHLSNALEIDFRSTDSHELLKRFNEPTYLHQVMLKMKDKSILRYRDIPAFFEDEELDHSLIKKARVHFHIPLYAEPESPLGSTSHHTVDALEYLWANPNTCAHLEMETYTWDVLPAELQKPLVDQLVDEYLWTLDKA